MVLHSPGCGRVGRRRTSFTKSHPFWGGSLCFPDIPIPYKRSRVRLQAFACAVERAPELATAPRARLRNDCATRTLRPPRRRRRRRRRGRGRHPWWPPATKQRGHRRSRLDTPSQTPSAVGRGRSTDPRADPHPESFVTPTLSSEGTDGLDLARPHRHRLGSRCRCRCSGDLHYWSVDGHGSRVSWTRLVGL